MCHMYAIKKQEIREASISVTTQLLLKCGSQVEIVVINIYMCRISYFSFLELSVATFTFSNSLKFTINTVPCNTESDTTQSHLGPSNLTSNRLARKTKQTKSRTFCNIFGILIKKNFHIYEAVYYFSDQFCIL